MNQLEIKQQQFHLDIHRFPNYHHWVFFWVAAVPYIFGVNDHTALRLFFPGTGY